MERFVSPRPDTIAALASVVAGTRTNDTGAAQADAFAALLAAKALDAESEKTALSSDEAELRRMAAAVLAGSGAGLDADARNRLVLDALHDASPTVRYEALGAYVRHIATTRGCDPILQAMQDEASFVSLAAVDALAQLCLDDEGITTRIVAESRPPPTMGSWTRQAHAFVTLAKRSPDRASISMAAFSSHQIWQVRMYAARAAASLNDVATLEKLAYDDNDNVREAALGPLRTLEKQDADAAIVAALGRRDYQLVRSAAVLLKESRANPTLAEPLVDALKRLTAEKRETSRDIRSALLDALEIHGTAHDAGALEPLLRDFDPVIATRAATILSKWTGSMVAAEPQPRHASDWGTVGRICVSLNLKKGGAFRMSMDGESAPITVRHFLELALHDHYYDGLTFHRVVPNFVIQGGSPGANEYWGQAAFMRDEVGALNSLGSVGVSTRGRNTGDAQFFVNLVENTRLDYDYTVFANVFPTDMSVVSSIEEGDAISTIDAGRLPPLRAVTPLAFPAA